MIVTSPFGQQVKQRRQALHLSHEDLAQRVGCATDTIHAIEEHGLLPPLALAEQLAQHLDLSPDERSALLQAAHATPPPARLGAVTQQLSGLELGDCEDLTGQTIKGYELREQIGKGGFGAVYRAYQPLIDRSVAIKVILPKFANQPEFIRRFESEAQIIARLEHPHIVPLYDYWREPDGAYLMMRYIRGGNLSSLLQHGPIALDTIARLIGQITTALTVAHRAGVIHRDLKPANILLDEQGNSYLADFGIAKDLLKADRIVRTQASVIIGSPAYLSPEQIRDEPVTPRTDVYSLGVVLYELLTGSKPFESSTPLDLIQKQLHTPLPPLGARRPDLPAELDAVIQRATAKQPDDRYASALALQADLRRALGVGDGLAQTPFIGTSLLSSVPAAKHTTEILDVPESDNPYKGLRAFAEADAADFFGRSVLIHTLLARLVDISIAQAGIGAHKLTKPIRHVADKRPPENNTHFLAVVGPSGSGKSSVVRAGLIPALRRGALPGSEKWFIVEMLPSERPFEELEAALLRVAVNPPDSLLGQLHHDERGLLRAVKRILPGDGSAELLLVIDQFEELFTLVTDEAVRTHFLNSLVAAVSDPHSQVRVIVTLRADFYDRPLRYPNLGELISARTEVVLPLTTNEVKEAISGPTARVGLALAPELIARIQDDVATQPGVLPLLQYALTELFARRVGRRLTMEAYHASGGVQGALTRRADQIYESLGAEAQAAARQVFLRLVTLGEGAEDTRRRVRLSELVFDSPSNHQTPGSHPQHDIQQTVISAYDKARLLTFDHDPITREPTVEVAHEALIRNWDRLRAWLEASRADLRMQRSLAAAAAEWASARYDPSFLASGVRLTQFASWATTSELALNSNERAYLEASIAERDTHEARENERKAREDRLELRSRRVLRALVVVLLLATVGALGLSAVALSQRRAAQNSAEEAQSLALVSGAQAALNKGSTDLALALAMVANQLPHPVAQAQPVLSEAAYAPGTRLLISAHTATVNVVRFSADGRFALTGSSDKTVGLWDLASGKEIRHFEDDQIQDLELSPDGHTFLEGSEDGSVVLWNLDTGAEVRRFAGHDASVYAVAISPDGTTALSGSSDKRIIMWDMATGAELRRFEGHIQIVREMQFLPDGRTFLSASDDKNIILWDVASGSEIKRFEGNTAGVWDIALSPDGSRLASGANNGRVMLWDVASGQPIREFEGHIDGVYGVAFSPDGRSLTSGGEDTSVIWWDIEKGRPIQRFVGHGAAVREVAFSPDGRQIISGSGDSTARVWDLISGAQIGGFRNAKALFGGTLSPDGKTALAGGSDQEVVLWDVATDTEIRRFKGHKGVVNGVAFSPDGKLAASAGGSGDKAVILWNLATGQAIQRFEGHKEDIYTVAFSPDGRQILSGSKDNKVIVWDIASGKSAMVFSEHSDRVFSVAYGPNGTTALSADRKGVILLWEVATGNVLRRFEGHEAAVRSVAFSPDGRRVLSGGEDKAVILWDAERGTMLRRFQDHNSAVRAVAFSPDGKQALSGSKDATVILWDLESGKALRRYTGHSGPINAVMFTLDGRGFLSASSDATMRRWRIDSLPDLVAWARANRYLPELSCEQHELYRLEGTCGPPSKL